LNTHRLDSFLVEQGYYESRARAASAIKAGKVKIDGILARKPSQKINPKSYIDAEKEHPWVSRGGLKLDHALNVFGVNAKHRVCLDVGASTGGFSDVLLSRGAARIYAVDVGRDQLHEKLQNDDRVMSMESTDARQLDAETFDPAPTLIVCDASFISAMKVLERPLQIVPSQSELVTLVKPQFEVGKDNIGRGGLVKDLDVAKRALETVAEWISSQGWMVLASDRSPIKGGDGNIEFLLHARKK